MFCLRVRICTHMCVLCVLFVSQISLALVNAIRTRIIEPHTRTLELPLLVRSVVFSFLFVLEG